MFSLIFKGKIESDEYSVLIGLTVEVTFTYSFNAINKTPPFLAT